MARPSGSVDLIDLDIDESWIRDVGGAVQEETGCHIVFLQPCRAGHSARGTDRNSQDEDIVYAAVRSTDRAAVRAAAATPPTGTRLSAGRTPHREVAIARAGAVRTIHRPRTARQPPRGHAVRAGGPQCRPRRRRRCRLVTGDACELANLERADLRDYDVMIAATGDDKANLVVALLAKTEFAVNRVVARVNDPRNEWLFGEDWGVDTAVSTPRILASPRRRGPSASATSSG